MEKLILFHEKNFKETLSVLMVSLTLISLSYMAILLRAQYQFYDEDTAVDDISDSYGNYAWFKALARGYYCLGDPYYRKGDAMVARGYEQGDVGYIEWADVLWYDLWIEHIEGVYWKNGYTYGDYYGITYEYPPGYGDPIVKMVHAEGDTSVKIYSPDDLPIIPLGGIAEVRKG